MKTNRLSRLFTLTVLLGAAGAPANVSFAGTKDAAAPGAAEPATTIKTRMIGPATEQVLYVQKCEDGSVIRVVQIRHQDGTAETRGIRVAPVSKS